MCGIVGYLGDRSPKDVVVSGLKSLEYRGYDSAGIAIQHKSEFKRIRAEGKLINLQNKLEGEIFEGRLGIGHTRWATHGVPSERNAHPHQVDGVSLVHNGIIENYQEIREDLIRSGADITSDTDSELVAHLLAREVKKTKSLAQAVLNILPRLHGAFAIVAVWDQEMESMVAFKNGPPLVLGVGQKEMIIASDIQAIVPYTNQIVYINDNEVLSVKSSTFQLFGLSGDLISRSPVQVQWTQEKAEKKGFPHFMLKEIFEQPRSVAAALEPHVDLKKNVLAEIDLELSSDKSKSIELSREFLKRIKRVHFVACGSSFYMAQLGCYLVEQIAKLPAQVDFASEFRYRSPILDRETLTVFISQSGETADTLAALRLAKDLKVPTLSICNVKLSSIDRVADARLYMRAGPEVAVASTKALASTMAVLNILALSLAKNQGQLSSIQEQKHIEALLGAPSLMEKVLNYTSFFEEAAHSLKNFKGFLYIGRGLSYSVALEGALKLKELAYMHAEGYAAGEMKHGPIALIDKEMGVVVIAPHDNVYEKTISNLEEVRARGGRVISIGTGDNERLRKISEHYLALPKAEWFINPFLSLIPVQLLSYYVSVAKGYDVDQPRNLAKSVTVE